jgi:hypothetical protein
MVPGPVISLGSIFECRCPYLDCWDPSQDHLGRVADVDSSSTDIEPPASACHDGMRRGASILRRVETFLRASG